MPGADEHEGDRQFRMPTSSNQAGRKARCRRLLSIATTALEAQVANAGRIRHGMLLAMPNVEVLASAAPFSSSSRPVAGGRSRARLIPQPGVVLRQSIHRGLPKHLAVSSEAFGLLDEALPV